MSLLLRCVLLGLLIGAFSAPALATHIIGGQLEMRPVGDKPGHFKVTVVYYFNDFAGIENYNEAALAIYRKRDNAQMATFKAVDTGTRGALVFTNEVCARLRNLKVSVARYEGEIQLNPANFNDPQGYYLQQPSCCRNDGILNVRTTSVTGFNASALSYVFYLEFPPLLRNGRAFVNTSPRFRTINGEYICRGEPFTYQFGADDADGDELRYSLVTPLQSGTPPLTSPGPYTQITWVSGFGVDRAIAGSPALQINPKTGELSVTATQLGLFAFAVNVEEFRNGQKIGEVRRDFQFLVADCPNVAPPEPVIQIQNQAPGSTEARLCPGSSFELRAPVNPTWHYQWRRDGINLSNATTFSLTIRNPGVYTVIASLKTECSRAVGSRSVTINPVTVSTRLSIEGPRQLCASGGTVTLKAPTTTTIGTDLAYVWHRDGLLISGQTSATLAVAQPGRYWASVTELTLNCTSITDTVSVGRVAAVPVVLTPPIKSVICPSDSVQLRASGGVRYVWQRDGQVLPSDSTEGFTTKNAGNYTVTALDSAGCQATSAPFQLTTVNQVALAFDSLPPVCGLIGPAVVLSASPAGGVFAGKGVSGNQFNPKLAGPGQHKLTYSIRVAPECPIDVVAQVVLVTTAPGIELPTEISTWTGNTLTLKPILTGAIVQFEWTPAALLTNASVLSPQTVPLEADVRYTLQVGNAAGCRTEASIKIRVAARIWVPDVFTPNGDGINEVWELKGIDAYPNAEVTIYNRWGQVVFRDNAGYTRPFNGTLAGQELPPGAYAYTLRPAPDRPLLRGVVTLAR
ncbi:MAG: gliding motility-associated C-terminal domain-containing protein [Cytophagaceae bacterium]|nr:gliding motility-associated C-terminal domain-containing protein [Cytophagaceae bacterium]